MQTHKERMSAIDEKIVTEAIMEHLGNQRQAAQDLGMNESTLRQKLVKFEIVLKNGGKTPKFFKMLVDHIQVNHLGEYTQDQSDSADTDCSDIGIIQSTVAEYYKVEVSDLISKNRDSSFVLPRHIAMSLSKDLTDNTLREIGMAFGGRDRTTVVYSCKKIKKLIVEDARFEDEYEKLVKTLTS